MKAKNLFLSLTKCGSEQKKKSTEKNIYKNNNKNEKCLLINYLTSNMTYYEERPYKLLSCKMDGSV